MKRIAIAILAATLLLFAVLATMAGTSEDYAVQAGSPSEVTPLAVRTEFWRLGVTSENGTAYNVTQGRLVRPAAMFRSYRNTTDVYHIFPAPGSQRTIQAAKYCILSRTGTYAGLATLTLEILDYAGTVQHTVSAAGIDMEMAPTGVWTAVTLSGTPADLEIAPGEFLVFHFSLSGAPAGDLAVYPVFEVEVVAPSALTPPNVPTLLAPPNGTITATQAITLVWAASTDAVGYHVQLDSNDMITTTGTTSPTVLPTGIHTWTVRAFNSAGASDWATPWTIEITDTLPPPNVPTLLAPPNGTSTTTHAITLTWQAGIGAVPTGYHVDMDGAIVTTTGTTSPTILSTGIHIWMVRAFNSVGSSDWATPWTVEITDTLPPPNVPTLLAPPNGTVTTTHAITFAWQAGMGAAPTGYHVDVDGAIVTTTGTTSPAILSFGVHTWTVQAFNSAGASDWATPWTIAVVRHKLFLPLVLRSFAP
jgi:hypothetical protein